MARPRQSLPAWLRHLASLPAAAKPPPGHLPQWTEALWPHIGIGGTKRLLLRGRLHFPAEAGPAELRAAAAGVRCGLGRPAASSRGIHGLHLFLADETDPDEVSALLLSPTAFTHLQAKPTREHPDVPVLALSEPVFVLETKRLRAEFTLQDKAYDATHPQLELLHSLTLEVVVWQRTRTQ